MQHSLTQGPITKNILLFALPLGGYRHLAQCAHRLGTGRCHRHWVLFEEENIKYPPLQSVLWHVCSGGYCFFWGLR